VALGPGTLGGRGLVFSCPVLTKSVVTLVQISEILI